MEIGQLTGTALGSAGDATKSATRLAEDFDTFLVLLTTQLQEQDPLDPLDSNEFTQQLVQFTSVEQAIAANQNLESVIQLLSGDSMTRLVDFIGKDITAAGDQATLSNGKAVWQYSIDGAANRTDILVTDSSGRVVFKGPGETAAGTHSFVWNGRDNLGSPLPGGAYKISVSAQSNDGSTVATSASIKGRVTSIEMADGQQTLVVNGLKVPLGNVTSVSESAPENT
ncbi:MAG: flagellar hook assembly protein FlgD [Sphingomonadales bacterium]